ncbi:MAG: hypothetical protein KatS3mg121_1047 [Gammaproteobacteria bacterium]|nr:MAG: hypothetical protein KatS3mg121_1047 [Gammaproteobacteria bacterium]
MAGETPSRVLLVIDKPADCGRFGRLLDELGGQIRWEAVSDAAALTAALAQPVDLVLYWHQRGVPEPQVVVEALADRDPPAVLVLVADQPGARDYVQAANWQASDVIHAGLPAQFAFVVRRELASVRLRRSLEAAIERIKASQIVDESAFETRAERPDLAAEVKLIDEALRNNQFELLFQPILAVEDDGVDRYELFLRIRRGDRYGEPWAFLPAAEQYGLMPAIDRWVVRNAVKRFKAECEVRKLRGESRRLTFFVNLSGHSLVEAAILNEIVTEMVQAKLPPGSFVVEVDKKTVLARLQKVKALNQHVKKLQLEFALDHYEPSDNQLNYLKHISLDYIKLARSVVQPLARDPRVKEGVKRIVEKARANGLKVVASQVENAEVLPVLYELGVDFIQGYLIAEPSSRLERPMLQETLEAGQG